VESCESRYDISHSISFYAWEGGRMFGGRGLKKKNLMLAVATQDNNKDLANCFDCAKIHYVQ
jgi:hypothetical protein